MTNQEILIKAIEKAIAGGWLGVEQRDNPKRIYHYPDSTQILKWHWEEDSRSFSDGEYDDYESINVEAIIFNHDFAKALWSVEKKKNAVGKSFTGGGSGGWAEVITKNGWQYHLQQMVIAENPIAYLGANI